MSDTTFLITGGFFDAVDSDRLYSADQMNQPYKKLIHDGINREADGSAPGFAVTAGGGMNVLVATGNAMIGGKWAENKAVQTIAVAGNTSGSVRIDSIILQCDKSRAVRAVQIVYRQGTAAAPDLVSDNDITELRLANIRVPSAASAIASENITDMRGGAECPWVRSVFDAPDARYIVEEYTGTELAGAYQTVKSAVDSIRYAAQSGQPTVALQASEMIDSNLVYLYQGNETGYSAGYLYYYSDAAGAWIRGAQYGASVVDTALDADSENPVQNKAVAAAITGLNERLTQQGTNIGDLSQLNTEEKADLVSAINEAANSGGVGSHALPVLYLYGDENEIQTNWNNRSKAKMNFRYVFHNLNKNKQKNGWCKLSLQGNATMSYPKHNFNIQFYKDAGFTTKDKVDYMDLTDDKHPKWTIKANYNDYSQGRNVVSARLWGDVVHCRPNMSNALSEAPNHGAIDGHPVILMMNDTYYGLYMFNMSKSDWMIGIDEDDPAHCAVSSNLATASTKWLSTGLSGWELEIPDTWQTVDIEGVSTSVQAGFLALQSFVINSTDADFYASLGDYLDINSAIDYLIYSFCVCNADSMNKNQFLVTWDAGKTWAFTAYDMDQTFGAGFTGEIPYNHDLFSTHPNHLFERLIANFSVEILERYAILRGSVFSTEYVKRELEIFFNEIPTGEREADKVLYPRIMFQSISTLEAMQTFAQNRLAWCDTYFAKLDPDYVACTGITLNKSRLSFSEVGESDTLIATTTPTECSDPIVWATSDPNVASISNGVVTSVGDGDCTVTVTCGEYSATASVSVEIDNTIVYRLPADSIGTTLVDAWDSGEMVFPSDGDISVVFDCEGTNFGGMQKFIILANEFFVRFKSGFNMVFGGAEGNAQDSSENLLTFGASKFNGNTLTSANPFKFVITHAVGETTATIYVKDTNGTKGSATVTKKSTNTSWYGNSNLIVGANGYRTVLNKLNVYNRVLSQSEIDAFLGN